MCEQSPINLLPVNWQVLHLLAEGRTNKDICTSLALKPRELKQLLRTLYGHVLKSFPQTDVAVAVCPQKQVGLGLPCSECRSYYPADRETCPICNSPDRVSPRLFQDVRIRDKAIPQWPGARSQSGELDTPIHGSELRIIGGSFEALSTPLIGCEPG
jgi:hypothetical protein